MAQSPACVIAEARVRSQVCQCEFNNTGTSFPVGNSGFPCHYRGSGSVIGIATAYGLDGPGIESLWGEIFRTSPDRS